jgi:hypothetical protein
MTMTGAQTTTEFYCQGDNITEIRPRLIRQEDCDVPMLCLDDFRIDQFGDEDESERRCRHHAQRFIEKAILSWNSNSTLKSISYKEKSNIIDLDFLLYLVSYLTILLYIKGLVTFFLFLFFLVCFLY